MTHTYSVRHTHTVSDTHTDTHTHTHMTMAYTALAQRHMVKTTELLLPLC